jgi:hypothetical protein
MNSMGKFRNAGALAVHSAHHKLCPLGKPARIPAAFHVTSCTLVTCPLPPDRRTSMDCSGAIQTLAARAFPSGFSRTLKEKE